MIIHNQRGSVSVVITGLILLSIVGLGVYFLTKQNNKQPLTPQQNIIDNTSVPSTTKPENATIPTHYEIKSDVSVRVVSGDIVATKNGKDSKITSWGYNSGPVLTPDGSKVAYISKTKESLVNEKLEGYKRTSTNVWIINSDGSNPVQVTNHVDFVYRSNPRWLDNNRLLFVDGAESARVYNTNTKILQTVMGPEKVVQACLDACGFEIKYYYSPDYSYLVRIEGRANGTSVIGILNTETLQLKEVNEKSGVDFNTVSFPNNATLTFQGSTLPDYNKQITVTVDLVTQKVSTY